MPVLALCYVIEWLYSCNNEWGSHVAIFTNGIIGLIVHFDHSMLTAQLIPCELHASCPEYRRVFLHSEWVGLLPTHSAGSYVANTQLLEDLSRPTLFFYWQLLDYLVLIYILKNGTDTQVFHFMKVYKHFCFQDHGVVQAVLQQEVVLYCGKLIATHTHLFTGILNIRIRYVKAVASKFLQYLILIYDWIYLLFIWGLTIFPY